METLAEQSHKPMGPAATAQSNGHYNDHYKTTTTTTPVNHSHQTNGLSEQAPRDKEEDTDAAPMFICKQQHLTSINNNSKSVGFELYSSSGTDSIKLTETKSTKSNTAPDSLSNSPVTDSDAEAATTEKEKQQAATPAPTPVAAAAAAAAGSGELPSVGKRLAVDCLMYVIRAIINLYDLISTPVHYIMHDVGRKQQLMQQALSHKIDPSDPDSPWRQIDIEQRHLDLEARIDSYDLYDELMKAALERHGDNPCFGYRSFVDERWVEKPGATATSGDKQAAKLMRQVRLSDYKWVTYRQFDKQIATARAGLVKEGVRPGDKVLLFADTRAEWQIASQALLRLGAVVVTMYATLGIDGIVHTMNETRVTHVITQRDKVRRLLGLRSKLPYLRKVIYFGTNLELPEQLGGSPDESTAGKFKGIAGRDDDETLRRACEMVNVECKTFKQLLLDGLERSEQVDDNSGQVRRSKDSVAVIMYTSGSTGIPKGVLISHRNILATLKAFSYVTKDFVHEPANNVCAAYLPLAHIFEFCIESVMLYNGVRYGFGTPHTLTDKSPGLVPGEKGDLTLLKPTVMIIVPLILDRVVGGIKQALKNESYFKQQFITYLLDYKQYWQKRQYSTPLIDRIVCSKMAAALGGRAKYVICGSAPLSASTQSFIRAALNLKLPQGFGTTETTAATACQLFDDQSTGNVGVPVTGAKVKLEAWPEGNYYPSDKPNPRGEIVVGGDMIALGYFNCEQQTKEAFYVDGKGARWYRTGDIGEFLPNGNLKIIDRKKDLVKLQNGEYISLGRVEATLKSNPYTDNFCVYANSAYNYVVALGPANEQSLCQLAQQIVHEQQKKTGSRSSPFSSSNASTSSSCDDNDSDDEAADEEAKGKQNHLTVTSAVNTRDRVRRCKNKNRSSTKSERPLLSPSESAASMYLSSSNANDGNTSGNTNQQSDEEALAELIEVIAMYEQDLANNNSNTGNAGNGDAAVEATTNSRKFSSGSSSGQEVVVVNERLKRLCNNKLIIDRILQRLTEMARERNLLSLEVPKKLLLIDEEWTEDKNLVTAAMKIRRNFIYKRYEQELAQLYDRQRYP